MRVLIVGCGYVGLPLGAELARQGHEVFGLRRTAGHETELAAAGLRPLRADITEPADLARLPRGYDWVVDCVSSGGGGVESYRSLYVEGARNLVAWLAPAPPARFVYTSSTGVYGQTEGEIVVETSATEPGAATAQILVETEQVLLAVARQEQFPAVVLRLAGIYGPGRGHWFKQYLAGEARIEGDGGRYLNMIHRDDVVGAIVRALQHGRDGEIYNGVDDEPVTQRAFYLWLAAALGGAVPPSVPEAKAASTRGQTNKRVSNHKLREVLGYEFKYPTFREGFQAEIVRLRGTRA